jgi:DASH complex subunit DAD3
MSAFASHDDQDTQDYSYVSPDHATTTPLMPQDMISDPEASHGRNRSANLLLGNDNPHVSELEQEVLDEYSRLLRNVNQVS